MILIIHHQYLAWQDRQSNHLMFSAFTSTVIGGVTSEGWMRLYISLLTGQRRNRGVQDSVSTSSSSWSSGSPTS